MLVTVKELKQMANGKQIPWIEELIKGRLDDEKLDLINRNDYVASKLWCREDVQNTLVEEGYEGIEEQVEMVIKSGLLSALNDCTDDDWNIMREAIRNTFSMKKEKMRAMEGSHKTLKKDMKDFSVAALIKEVERQFSEGNKNSFGEPLAYVSVETGEIFEIILELFINQYSLLIHDANGVPMRQHFHADTLEELLRDGINALKKA